MWNRVRRPSRARNVSVVQAALVSRALLQERLHLRGADGDEEALGFRGHHPIGENAAFGEDLPALDAKQLAFDQEFGVEWRRPAVPDGEGTRCGAGVAPASACRDGHERQAPFPAGLRQGE